MQRLWDWTVVSQSDSHTLPVIQSRLQVSRSTCLSATHCRKLCVQVSVCVCVCVSLYVFMWLRMCVCVSVPALLSILMTGGMMNGTESVVFILGRITQSGSHPGLQSQLLGQHWDTHHLTHALNRRLHASCMHTDMERRCSQYTVDSYTKHCGKLNQSHLKWFSRVPEIRT